MRNCFCFWVASSISSHIFEMIMFLTPQWNKFSITRGVSNCSSELHSSDSFCTTWEINVAFFSSFQIKKESVWPKMKKKGWRPTLGEKNELPGGGHMNKKLKTYLKPFFDLITIGSSIMFISWTWEACPLNDTFKKMNTIF